MTPRIGSLFSGYGGLDRGARTVLGGDVAWHCEIEPAAVKLLEHHHPDVPNLGDITQVDWPTVAPVDVLTLGFPCQDVSSAGLRAGMKPGNRSGLWEHAARAISVLRPSLVVVENVRGLLSAEAEREREPYLHCRLCGWSDRVRPPESGLAQAQHEGAPCPDCGGVLDEADCDLEPCPWCLGDERERPLRALGAVLGDLAVLGYDAEWACVRAADAGAPHGRARVFIVARPVDSDTAERGRGSTRWDDGVRPAGLVAGAAGDPDSVHRQGRPAAELTEQAGSTTRPVANPQDDRREWGGTARARRTGPQNGRDKIAADPNGTGRERAESARRRNMSAWCVAPDADDCVLTTEPGGMAHGTASGERGNAGDNRGSGDCREGGCSGATDWGSYASAIARWERVLGRVAPAPTRTGARGGQQLSPRFVEWIMGLPDGWVTDVPGLSRNQQLKLLGNGVVPQQAELALRYLLAADRSAVAA